MAHLEPHEDRSLGQIRRHKSLAISVDYDLYWARRLIGSPVTKRGALTRDKPREKNPTPHRNDLIGHIAG